MMLVNSNYNILPKSTVANNTNYTPPTLDSEIANFGKKKHQEGGSEAEETLIK